MKAAEAATNRYAESAHVCIRKVFRILSLAPRLGDDMKRRSSLIIFKREHDGARVVSKVKHEFLASTLRNGVFLMGLGAHKLSAALSSCLHSTTGVQIALRATDVSSGVSSCIHRSPQSGYAITMLFCTHR